MVFVFKIGFYVSVHVNVSYLTWVLGTELRPSGGAGSAEQGALPLASEPSLYPHVFKIEDPKA